MLEHLKLFVNWKMRGADATKVGIGPGKVCITKVKTGFGTGGWQLAALRWCSKAARNQSLRTVGFGPMAILPNRFVSGRLWS